MRSNFEALETEWLNRMDPMKIEPQWRDPFPKMDLHLGFVGDKQPLCVDLPDKQFLRIGAKYRLLGSSKRPDLQEQPSSWNIHAIKVTTLEGHSQLRNALSGLQPEITLTSNLICTGIECDLDNVRLVEVQQNPPIYYEVSSREHAHDILLVSLSTINSHTNCLCFLNYYYYYFLVCSSFLCRTFILRI